MGQVNVRVMPSIICTRLTTILPSSSTDDASALAITSYGPVTSSAGPSHRLRKRASLRQTTAEAVIRLTSAPSPGRTSTGFPLAESRSSSPPTTCSPLSAIAAARGWKVRPSSWRGRPTCHRRAWCPARCRCRATVYPSLSAPTGRSPAATRASPPSSAPTCPSWHRDAQGGRSGSSRRRWPKRSLPGDRGDDRLERRRGRRLRRRVAPPLPHFGQRRLRNARRQPRLDESH